MGNHGEREKKHSTENEFEIPIDFDSQPSEEELRKQMKEAGFHVDEDDLAKAQEHDKKTHLIKVNATAEAIMVHIDSKLAQIGAQSVEIIPIPLDTEEPLEGLRSRIKITDANSGGYYVDLRLDEMGKIEKLFIPPALNPIREEIQAVFDQMNEYGNLSPHAVE